ncbi:MAG: division/cell wall cluster transcriptional repressor MraZ [Actinomycetota bacterium]|nr:division/cell wall cluster transcriptional repressor MraZ [Actinomycetota bacterium]
MFYGEYERSLDDKGRVILPAEFRNLLGDNGFITKVLDGCLAIYTTEEFDKVAATMQENARRGGQTERHVARSFAAGSRPIAPDRQGRIAVPPNLQEFAGLTRDVMVNGSINRIEIWDATRWRAVNQEGERMLRDADAGLAGMTI